MGRYQMTFSRKESNLVTTIIIVKRRSGMTLEPEVNQLFAARMDNTRAVTRYLRSMEMRIKKQRKVTVAASQGGQVGQMQAKVGKEVRTDHQKEERMPSIT